MILADTMLLKPEGYPGTHVSGTDEKKGQVYGISGEFQRLGKPCPLVPILTADFCFHISYFQQKQERRIRAF